MGEKIFIFYILGLVSLSAIIYLLKRTSDGFYPIARSLNPFNNLTKVFDISTESFDEVKKCNSVFPGMLHGRWIPRKNVTEFRRKEMDEYLENTRAEYRIPRSLQRSDGLCGALPYDQVPLFRHMWFRSVCNPLGSMPCCYDFRCSNRTVEDCKCPRCLDSRTPLHAELSDWLPASPACGVQDFGASEACEMLKGTRLILAGDSFVRHLFVALVMLLTDNYKDGALRKDAPEDIHQRCLGMYQVNGVKCRDILDENRTLCQGRVHATYLEVWYSKKGEFLIPLIQNLVSSNRRVLLVAGLGIHDDFRVDLVWPIFLQKLSAYFVGSSRSPRTANFSQVTAGYQAGPNSVTSFPLPKWPKMIWASAHAPGLLKASVYPAQSYEGVLHFNEKIAQLLDPFGIPILDSFNMTAPLHSVDGTHYGYGANALKVQFLLNWIQESHDRHKW